MSARRESAFGSALLTLGMLASIAAPAGAPAPGSAPMRTIAVATIAPANVHVTFTRVATGLHQPIAIASARDGSGRLFVVEQAGTIRVVEKGALRPGYYLDIRDRVRVANDGQGLLSVAFHRGFTKHPFLYVAYTRRGALQVSRFRASSASAHSVSAATEVPILSAHYSLDSEHNGSQVMFGQDGFLYITTGDGGGPRDPSDTARDLSSLLGKVLRLDVDKRCGTQHYCIPSSNPLVGTSKGRPAIFDWGLRNPWRMSQDRSDGTLWLGDVGQAAWEEIDHVRAVGGWDFGWSCQEGPATLRPGRCAGRVLTRPLRFYSHDAGRCAVIGGYVYRGTRYSFARGLYLYGDFCTGEVWAVGRYGSGQWVRSKVGDMGSLLNSFGESGNGEQYAVDHSGSLFHVVFHRR